MTKEIQKTENTNVANPIDIDHMDIDRQLNAFSKSSLIPEHFKGKPSAIVIAMDMAKSLNVRTTVLMNGTYEVHGKLEFSAQFLTALINRSKELKGKIKYEFTKDKDEKIISCRAWGIERETNDRLDGSWVTKELVRAEGWDTKKGSKWLTMPDRMYQYRAVTFFARTFFPELLLGNAGEGEAIDIIKSSNQNQTATHIPSFGTKSQQIDKVNEETGEVIEGTELLEEPPKHQKHVNTHAQNG